MCEVDHALTGCRTCYPSLDHQLAPPPPPPPLPPTSSTMHYCTLTSHSHTHSRSRPLPLGHLQMHRDTRLQEMVGNSVIVREVDADGGGEVIRQQNEPGGIITAELCVLDDVSRAPGEALNILLRILNERKFGGSDIPLLSAIATANPADDAYYNEPLDPANIDRFALQVKASGLIQQQRWTDVAAVISLFASGSAPSTAPSDRVPESCDDRDGPTPEVGVSRELLDTAYAELQAVEVTAEVTAHLVTFLHVLSTRYGLTEHNSLLTDRTFLVKAVKILKAQACMSGRTKTAPCDMEVLSLLTTFRVPPNVHIKVPTILGDILAGKIAHPSTLGGAGAVPSLTPSVDTPPPSSHPSVATTPPRERTAVSSDSPASVENVVMSPRHPVPERLLLDKVDTGQPVTIDEDGGRLRGLLDRLTRGKGRM